MAFRTETTTGARLVLWLALAATAFAETYPVQHRHLRHAGAGTLRIDASGIAFMEPGKQASHSRDWKYEDIQLLTLSEKSLRIRTYEDQKKQLGRDLVYDFDGLPADLAKTWYPVFSKTLDQRFVAALADPPLQPEWQVPAKLLHGNSGSQGMLLVGKDVLVYQCTQPGESRTWRLKDILNTSRAGVFYLTLNTHEKDFRFQLKQPLPEARADELWRRVNQVNGLQILSLKGAKQ